MDPTTFFRWTGWVWRSPVSRDWLEEAREYL
jgi:hypothetical protein